MIILATTIIISLNNNGIIDKANDAVDKTNEKQVEELASLAWANAYADNVGKSQTELQAKLQEAVEKALSDNNVNKEDYGMEVTTTGVTIVKGWLQKANRTVVKGNTTLEIGDYVNYVSGVSGYTDTNGWQVLGAENGELLLLSADDVSSVCFSTNGILEGIDSTDSYITGVAYINSLCELYGEGEYAIGARSITVEDVDRVTGYDKTTYGKGKLWEYGNVVTYTYNGTNPPTYSDSNGQTGTLTNTHSNGFNWVDSDNVYHNVTLTSGSTGIIKDNGVEAKLTSTSYGYDVDQETDLKPEGKTKNAYNMLFGADDSRNYRLASQYVSTSTYCVGFGLRKVVFGEVTADTFLTSSSLSGGDEGFMVRAVVRLESTVTCTGSSEAGWNIV